MEALSWELASKEDRTLGAAYPKIMPRQGRPKPVSLRPLLQIFSLHRDMELRQSGDRTALTFQLKAF